VRREACAHRAGEPPRAPGAARVRIRRSGDPSSTSRSRWSRSATADTPGPSGRSQSC